MARSYHLTASRTLSGVTHLTDRTQGFEVCAQIIARGRLKGRYGGKNGRLVPPDFMRPFSFQQKGLDPLRKHHILDLILIVLKHDVVTDEFL